MAEECSLHLAFRWYLGYDLDEPTPNHSILSKARTRYGRKVFEQFFAHVLQRCVQAGLMREERLFADSTLIEANASGQSLENRESDTRPAFKPSEYVDKVFAENPGEAGQESVAGPISSVEQEIADRKSQWTKGKSTRGRKPSQKRRLNLRQISKTDPAAALVPTAWNEGQTGLQEPLHGRWRSSNHHGGYCEPAGAFEQDVAVLGAMGARNRLLP